MNIRKGNTIFICKKLLIAVNIKSCIVILSIILQLKEIYYCTRQTFLKTITDRDGYNEYGKVIQFLMP